MWWAAPQQAKPEPNVIPFVTAAEAPGAVSATAFVDRRHDNRLAVQTVVGTRLDANPNAVELRDLSMSGAFVVPRRITVSKNAGLRLEFTLPQGFRVNAFARVAWIRDCADEFGPMGYGVQFCGLNDMNREFMQYYIDLLDDGGSAPIQGARADLCYEVNTRGSTQLYVRVTGALHPFEAEALDAAVGRALATLRPGPIYVYIDARDIGVCSKSSMEHIRNWFERLRHNHQVLGVLVGGDTIGIVQVRRMARDAAIADSLVMFSEQANAVTFWGTLVGDVGILGAVA